MVAECSISFWKFVVKRTGNIRIKYVGMSNVKQCEKHCHRKS